MMDGILWSRLFSAWTAAVVITVRPLPLASTQLAYSIPATKSTQLPHGYYKLRDIRSSSGFGVTSRYIVADWPKVNRIQADVVSSLTRDEGV